MNAEKPDDVLADLERKHGSQQRVVSLRFGELKYGGCNTHPHRLDLSCAKIRRVNGDPLTNADVWEVLKELSAGKQANNDYATVVRILK